MILSIHQPPEWSFYSKCCVCSLNQGAPCTVQGLEFDLISISACGWQNGHFWSVTQSYSWCVRYLYMSFWQNLLILPDISGASAPWTLWSEDVVFLLRVHTQLHTQQCPGTTHWRAGGRKWEPWPLLGVWTATRAFVASPGMQTLLVANPMSMHTWWLARVAARAVGSAWPKFAALLEVLQCLASSLLTSTLPPCTLPPLDTAQKLIQIKWICKATSRGSFCGFCQLCSQSDVDIYWYILT